MLFYLPRSDALFSNYFEEDLLPVWPTQGTISPKLIGLVGVIADAYYRLFIADAK